MIFGEKIQFQRKKSGITQEELSEAMEVSRQAIAKWEAGLSFPEVKKIIKLSYLFNVSIDYLLKDEIENYEENNKKEIEKTKYIYPKKMIFLIILSLLCLIGIINMYYNSIINPVTITDWDGTYYSGFLGYLHINNKKNIFYILLIVLISCGITLFLKYKTMVNKKVIK
ncbi:helix-turn-helix domain-containing protein [Cetobacterium somerae]